MNLQMKEDVADGRKNSRHYHDRGVGTSRCNLANRGHDRRPKYSLGPGHKWKTVEYPRVRKFRTGEVRRRWDGGRGEEKRSDIYGLM